MSVDRPLKLHRIACDVASEVAGFGAPRGAGEGNRRTIKFMKTIRLHAIKAFGEDLSEQKLCGDNSLAVDFYFEKEATIVEIAFGLPNPGSEFEKDVLKAILAKKRGTRVDRLFFISRPGGKRKCAQPGRAAVANWLNRAHRIRIEVHDLPGQPRTKKRGNNR